MFKKKNEILGKPWGGRDKYQGSVTQQRTPTPPQVFTKNFIFLKTHYSGEVEEQNELCEKCGVWGGGGFISHSMPLRRAAAERYLALHRSLSFIWVLLLRAACSPGEEEGRGMLLH